MKDYVEASLFIGAIPPDVNLAVDLFAQGVKVFGRNPGPSCRGLATQLGGGENFVCDTSVGHLAIANACDSGIHKCGHLAGSLRNRVPWAPLQGRGRFRIISDSQDHVITKLRKLVAIVPTLGPYLNRSYLGQFRL